MGLFIPTDAFGSDQFEGGSRYIELYGSKQYDFISAITGNNYFNPMNEYLCRDDVMCDYGFSQYGMYAEGTQY